MKNLTGAAGNSNDDATANTTVSATQDELQLTTTTTTTINKAATTTRVPAWGWVVGIVLVGLILAAGGSIHLLKLSEGSTTPRLTALTALTTTTTTNVPNLLISLTPPSSPSEALSSFTPPQASASGSSTSTPAPTEPPSFLMNIPIGEMGQDYVQGEYGLLASKVELYAPNSGKANTQAGIAVELAILDFQGSYYDHRSLEGAKVLIVSQSSLPSGTTTQVPILKYYQLVSDPSRRKEPALDLNAKRKLSFGERVQGWLTFEPISMPSAQVLSGYGLAGGYSPTGATVSLLPQIKTGLELRFLPTNTGFPLRLHLLTPMSDVP